MNVIHRRGADASRREALGPYVIESLIDPDEERAGTVYRVVIGAGTTTSTSYHARAEEYYYVLAGEGTLVLEGRDVPVAAGDFLRLPPGLTHAFVTAAVPLELLNVHTPGCRPDRDTFFVGEVPEGFGERAGSPSTSPAAGEEASASGKGEPVR